MCGLRWAPHLAKSGVLHCDLTEEKVHVVPVLNSMEEMGLYGRQEEKMCDKHAGSDALFPTWQRVESGLGAQRVNTDAQFGNRIQEKRRGRVLSN